MTQTVRDFLERKKEDGHVFQAGAVDRGIRKNESFKLFINNTDVGQTNERYAIAGEIQIQASGQFIAETTVNPTVESQGTQLDVVNLRTDSTATSDVRVYNGGTYSGGESYPSVVSPVSGGNGDVPSVLLAPGDSFLVDAQIRNPGGADVSKNFVWTPIPENIVPPVTDIDTGEKL